MRFFKQHDIRLPRHQTRGVHQGELWWKSPSAAAIYAIIGNPAYAGAFVYGRRPTAAAHRIPGRHATGVVRKPMAEWQTMQHGAYPAYITWEQSWMNQTRMRDNALRHTERTRSGRGAPREGAALLQGLATCGACGHRRKPASKSGVRYLWDGLSKEFAQAMCASLDGSSVEAYVVQAFCAALQPAHLDAVASLLGQRQQEQRQRARHWAQQRQRATYEVHLAHRRYAGVETENRLVAAALARHGEETLLALRQTEADVAHLRLTPGLPARTPEVRQPLTHIAQVLPEMWHNGLLTHAQQQLLLRRLIARVVLTRIAPDQVAVKSVWVSGHCSVGQVTPFIHRPAAVSRYDEMVTHLHDLWQAGPDAAALAAILTAEGFQGARSVEVSGVTVAKSRRQ